MANAEPLEEQLLKKIKVLNETTWELRAKKPKIEQWLENFSDDKEKLHMLFLLSQFMYFGSLQIRELLKSLYRDLYRYPVIERIRIDNSGNADLAFLNLEFIKAEQETRFLGIGNPSESGTHLLYFFRQENRLSKKQFINTHEIFRRDSAGLLLLANPDIKHYVFIDDFCGSGSQASDYSTDIISEIKKIDSTIKTSYLMLFSTKFGKDQVKALAQFDYVDTVVELDDSFKCFDSASRYFHNAPSEIDKSYTQQVCEGYGKTLMTSVCSQLGLQIAHTRH